MKPKSKQVAGMADPIEPPVTGWQLLKIVGLVGAGCLVVGMAIVDGKWERKIHGL